MSLLFGYDEKDNKTQRLRSLRYTFMYESISTTYRVPTYLRSGYPPLNVYAGKLTADSEITLLTHMFDNDNTISTLTVRYTIQGIKLDGSSDQVDLVDVDMPTKRVGQSNIYFIDETFNISNLLSDYSQLAVIHIKFKQLSSETYGNESILDIVVDY